MKFEWSIVKKKAQADVEFQIIRAEGQAKSQEIINEKLIRKYLQYKAFESKNSKSQQIKRICRL